MSVCTRTAVCGYPRHAGCAPRNRSPDVCRHQQATLFADRIIDHFELRPHFERVFGSELDGTRVHKSDLLEYALRETSVDPGRAVMIGDRSHDIVGAKNNGIKGIGVLYGYGSRTSWSGPVHSMSARRPRRSSAAFRKIRVRAIRATVDKFLKLQRILGATHQISGTPLTFLKDVA